ncbi:unnamed protein product [Plutella xylostella]|uniref:(diamondback moth) hypothetical protein n=1 Tax=Plutella xylostella TaxID=51655 RepID=A0A8S4G337_PLUXY|nr:unnamed protein product [Plutella xylostella]
MGSMVNEECRFLEAKLFNQILHIVTNLHFVCELSDGRETTSVCALFATGSY